MSGTRSQINQREARPRYPHISRGAEFYFDNTPCCGVARNPYRPSKEPRPHALPRRVCIRSLLNMQITLIWPVMNLQLIWPSILILRNVNPSTTPATWGFRCCLRSTSPHFSNCSDFTAPVEQYGPQNSGPFYVTQEMGGEKSDWRPTRSRIAQQSPVLAMLRCG